MAEKKLDLENIKSYWISEAEEALNVTDHLFEKKEIYKWLKAKID